MAPKKKGSPKADAKAPATKEIDEDWLGDASDGEENLGFSASDDDDVDGEGGESSTGEESGSDAGSDGEIGEGAIMPVDDDGEATGPRAGSKLLAKLASGEQPADLSTIKQRIQDAAEKLSDWRKATKELGEKRSRTEVMAGLVSDCSTYYGYAEELAEYFLNMFNPEQAIQFFEANEKARPLTIRTNSLKARRQTLIQTLQARKVQAEPVGSWSKVGLKVFEAAVPVGATPEYLGGQYMIQSASSFVPVMALAPQQDETILDMAAAPGGKTTYIGQLMKNTGTLYANDMKKERCKAVVANVHRMGLTNVIALCMDGRKLGGMLPRMDRVLLDAPCSGSGIIARDPAVKIKRGSKDFEEISRVQKELLATAIDLVDADSKTGGYIVYSTCSVAVEENEAVVQYALNARNVKLVSFSSAVNFGVEGMTKYRDRRFHPSMNLCRRYYPHVHNMDGFFVAKFKKLSNKIPERGRRQRGTDDIQVWGEEHWTPEMMETVVDFQPKVPAMDKAALKKASKGLNKIERKKLKRAAQLASRAAATTSVGAAAVEAQAAEGQTPAAAGAQAAIAKGPALTSSVPSSSSSPAKKEKRGAEPEEEPQPPTSKGVKRKGAASAGNKAKKAAAAAASATQQTEEKEEAAPPAAAAAAKTAKAATTKKAKAAKTASTTPPNTAPSDDKAGPARKKKKKTI
mmetsp:Transcript_39327/g.83776  ORF Transcript_39327/g.83776 Transcript_39327/m.83776 type:complete len:687 (-) Transcript_39327:58-2118(-)